MVQVQTVSQAGEEAVLTAIREVIDPHNAARAGMPVGPGDDAAVVRFSGAEVVITADTMSEGQDFRRQWWGAAATVPTGSGEPAEQWPMDVGTKAAAQNLSDINAMGTEAHALLVSLTLPAQTPVAWVQNFYRGILRACQRPGAAQCLVVGGDLASGEAISVTITALGAAPAHGAALRRDTAQAGEVVAVAGRLGYAAAGLALLEQQTCGTETAAASSTRSLEAKTLQQCRDAQTRPDPPLQAGGTALAAGARAGMDLSDGLLRDATRLAEASKVSIRLDDDALAAEAQKLHPVATALGVGPEEALEWVLAGGEDYSLLAVFPAGGTLPEGFRRIGSVEQSSELGGDPAVLTRHRVTGAGWDSVSQ